MSSQQDIPEYSEPPYTRSEPVDRAKFPFYQPNINKKLVPETRQLLEKYSHVPPEKQSQHVHKIASIPFQAPCKPQRIPVYPEILKRVQAGELLLDVGCFLGHDLRRLAYDGAPSTNLYGLDIANHWNVGFELFRDQSHFGAHFIEADILSESDSALLALKGKVDIVSALQVIHQWDWEGQVKAAKVLATFTKPGSLVVGNSIGNSKAQEVTLKSIGVPMYRQNPESFEKLWIQVGNETGTKWETQAWLRSFEEMSFDPKDHAWMEDGVAMLEFSVRRTE
ncbi:hypothetical protein G7Y89_g12114 [Cudoniella acicularis]|uniref:Methyltransferase domain-containing protein n=1 Tax=Cudoniella acicularis TaxID=354080 RepID=A0A8H4RD79_9HELO|nr:hypothetical protein G7Y89_g12114 [Cudoniella acicularis]